ncbi:MAG TPA: methyltransferase domain-containing protein [Bauldia sp.]|nr:methyltransferase domain-containing protein [Bauldia sp.]
MAEERTDSWTRVEGAERVAEATAKLLALGGSAAEMRVRKRALDMLNLRSGEIVIDVGAGAGVLTVDLARMVAPGGRVFAVDPSVGLLEQARIVTRDAGIGHLVDVRVADGRALPFGAAFDAAVCHWVLLHVDKPQDIIAEMRRVTRRGGRVLSIEMDWETAMVHPGDRVVTRRILNHSADRSIDPWIGRRLSGLFAMAGFSEVVAQPLLLTDQGTTDRAWLDWLLERASFALEAAVITRDDYAGWTEGLNAAFAAGRFFFAVVQFAVLGRIAA